MTRREAFLTAAGIFAIALAVRTASAVQIRFPVPEDTAYYVEVARNVLHGRGFVIDALWSYQTPPLELPRAAFEVWLPLPTLLAAVPMAIFGDSFRAAQVSSVLVGALVPVLTWALAREVAVELALPPGRARTIAIGSGLVAAVVPSLVVYSALPDSTMPFAALTLGAALLMVRIAASPPPPSGVVRDPRLLGLGGLLGLGALCRSEALLLGIAWLALVVAFGPRGRALRLALVAVPALVAAAVYLPWGLRDWLTFGNPLPGQSLANALSVSPFDIYAWSDPPALSRYVAQGPAALAQQRVVGTLHNLVSVLLLPAIPSAAIGLLAVPVAVRLRSLRPLLLFAAITFAVASLVFPVSTLWGTFLHSAGAIQALLAVMALVGLDRLIAAVGRFRGWTRPVAWLGPALVIAVAVPLLGVSVRAMSTTAAETEARYEALPETLRRGDAARGPGPVISDHPIWVATAAGIPALALPNESPDAVVSLARHFGATLVVVQSDAEGEWPSILSHESPGRACFQEVALSTAPADTSGDAAASAAGTSPLARTRVFRVVCR